jgi:hypothetical protein
MQIPAMAVVGSIDAIVPVQACRRDTIGLGLALIAFRIAEA